MLTYDDIDAALAPTLAALPLQTGIRPARPADAYIVTPNLLRDRIAAGTVDPKALLRTSAGPIRERWTALKDEGLRGLEDIAAHDAAAEAAAPAPIPGLRRKYGDLAHRMRIGLTTPGRDGAVAVRSLVEADPAALDGLLDPLVDTPEHAAQALVNLRRFDDVVVRVRAARLAASITRVPVAEVLALYREEGNLAVFPSDASIEHGLPSAATADNPTGREETYITLGHRPDISNLVWLADTAKATHEAKGAMLERYALATTFMVQPVGLDHIAGRFTGSGIVDEFGRVSAANWIVAGLADGGDLDARRAEARARWAALENDLAVRHTRGHSGAEDPAVRILPGTPDTFLAGILAEAMAYELAVRQAAELLDDAAAPPFGDTLTWIRYNSQATPTTFVALLVSALLDASSARGRSALRDAIASDAGMQALLRRTRVAMARAPRVKGAIESAQAGVASRTVFGADGAGRTVLDPAFAAWLRRAANQALLEQHVATRGARPGQWTGYQKMRSYAWHRRLLRDFYARVNPG